MTGDANTDETAQRNPAVASSDFAHCRCFQQRSEKSFTQFVHAICYTASSLHAHFYLFLSLASPSFMISCILQDLGCLYFEDLILLREKLKDEWET